MRMSLVTINVLPSSSAPPSLSAQNPSAPPSQGKVLTSEGEASLVALRCTSGCLPGEILTSEGKASRLQGFFLIAPRLPFWLPPTASQVHFLAEEGEASPIAAAVSLANPWDLTLSDQMWRRGGWRRLTAAGGVQYVSWQQQCSRRCGRSRCCSVPVAPCHKCCSVPVAPSHKLPKMCVVRTT